VVNKEREGSRRRKKKGGTPTPKRKKGDRQEKQPFKDVDARNPTLNIRGEKKKEDYKAT